MSTGFPLTICGNDNKAQEEDGFPPMSPFPPIFCYAKYDMGDCVHGDMGGDYRPDFIGE